MWSYLVLVHFIGKFTAAISFSSPFPPSTFPPLLTVNVLITKMPISVKVLKTVFSEEIGTLKSSFTLRYPNLSTGPFTLCDVADNSVLLQLAPG